MCNFPIKKSLSELDETPTLNRSHLVNWVKEKRSQGFCAVMGFSDIEPLKMFYGKEINQAIWDGCATKLVYNPPELDSAKLNQSDHS